MTESVAVVRRSTETVYRTFWKLTSAKTGPNYFFEPGDRRRCGEEEGVLVSSLCHNGKHAPVIDLDLPAQLLPSTTEGHFHLFIGREMRWWRYRLLLWALRRAGLIDKGFYRVSRKFKQSMVWKPGVDSSEYLREFRDGPFS